MIKNVFRTIDYQPTKIFTWFVEQVTEARRTGDKEKKQGAAGRGIQTVIIRK